MQFRPIFNAAQDQSFEILDVAARALENADCTVFVEKTVPASELDVMALASLVEILACDTSLSPSTLAWYAAQGVEW